MPFFVFTGDPNAPGTDRASINFDGVRFALNGEAVSVDGALARRLASHSHFTEVMEAAPKAPKGRRVRKELESQTDESVDDEPAPAV